MLGQPGANQSANTYVRRSLEVPFLLTTSFESSFGQNCHVDLSSITRLSLRSTFTSTSSPSRNGKSPSRAISVGM